MPSASERTELIVIERPTAATNEYNETTYTWPGTIYATLRARVRFGTGQEAREAAQQAGTQTATFECVRSSLVDAVTLKDRISYLGSPWNLTAIAPLDRATTRFTGTRTL